MDDLNKSLQKSILSKDTKDLALDYSELALDKILDNDALKEIPIIKTILAIYKTGVGLKERFTLKKVAKFLFRLNTVPEDEKEKFFNKLSSNENYKNEVVEKLIILLERLDDIDKAEIIGNLFNATIQDDITIDDFYKLSSIIDRTYIDDLKSFCYSYDYNLEDSIRAEITNQGLFSCTKEVEKNLASLGLMAESIKVTNNRLQFGTNKLDYSFHYETTQLGEIMVKYAKPTFKSPRGVNY